ncbi:MAG: TetR/AcrR family transcriptional regulator [bacterium]|nr:TetR/AcrR family transcriptional regulator [bacterium]
MPTDSPLSTDAEASSPPGRGDRRVQEFRARVLTTAEELFTERGIEATKIDDICEAADVAKRTLCNHFPTKADIVQALSREAVSRMVASIDEARVAGATTRERITLLFDGFFSGDFEIGPVHREFVGAFFGAAHGTPDASEGEIRVSDAIQALLAEGGPDQLPPGASIETFAEVVLGSIYATTLEWVHRDDYDVEARTSEVGRFLASLLPRR